MAGYSLKFDEALKLAASAHRDQVRKGTDIPYVTHVVMVATILLRHGFDEDLAVAGLLHDIVEDQDVPIAVIAAGFGEEVARLVDAVSEQKHDGTTEIPWEQRKAEALAHLRAADERVAALKAADALHNAHSLANDIRHDGAVVWQRFKRGPQSTLGYYRSIGEITREKLGKHPIVAELDAAIADLSSVSGVDSHVQNE